jgi:hypothetical protein
MVEPTRAAGQVRHLRRVRSTATVLRVPGTAAAITQPVRQRGTASRASEAAPAASPVAAPAATPVKAARKKPGRPPGRKKVGRPAGRPKGRVGRRKGSGTRALEALSFVQAQPGITIPELAGKMGIKQELPLPGAPGLGARWKAGEEGSRLAPQGGLGPAATSDPSTDRRPHGVARFSARRRALRGRQAPRSVR